LLNQAFPPSFPAKSVIMSQNFVSPKLPTHVDGTEIRYADQWKESSKFFVHRAGNDVRIGFSSGIDDENTMPIHSQVSMTIEEAEQLQALLGQAISRQRGTRVRARRRPESKSTEQRIDHAAKLASLGEIYDD
jgi:hypothetical protein